MEFGYDKNPSAATLGFSIPNFGNGKVYAHRLTTKVMENANPHAVLNPCPPFYRGEEVSKEVIESNFFVGYEFKKCLLEVQQAIILFLNNHLLLKLIQ